MNIARNLQNNYIRYLIIIFVLIATVFLIIVISPKRISGDFDVYYHASKNYLANAPVYTPHNGIQEFKYLPLFALVFSPLTMLEEVPALYLWSIFNIFLFYFMFYLFYKLKQISFATTKDLLIIVLLFALTGRYIFSNIVIGQVNILLCFLMVLTMYLELNKKYFWTGAVLAFSLMIKFFGLLFLLYFILTKQFKIAAYTVLMAIFFLLLPAIYSGFDQNLKYLQEWHILLKSSPAHLFYSVKNNSILSFFSWFFIARHEPYYIFDYDLITKRLTPEVYLAWAFSCALFFWFFFYDTFFVKQKDFKIRQLDYACLFVCALLFNPLAYLNALIFLVVPYSIVLRYLFYSEIRKKYVLAVGLLISFSFILMFDDNLAFFKNKYAFYAFLECRPLMWTVILVYISLWLMKFSQWRSNADFSRRR